MENSLDLSFWTLAIQYLALAENAAAEIESVGNPWFLVSDHEITSDSYAEQTKWSDHNVVLPVLFNFYHGIELLLKSFLIAAPGFQLRPKHGLRFLLADFEILYPAEVGLGAFFAKYIQESCVPGFIGGFIKKNRLSIDRLYEAFRYPTGRNFAQIHEYAELKYQESKGTAFFSELKRDIDSARGLAVRLGRSIQDARRGKG